jgi:peptidoglycan/LPS O-acetylase OafA/YrhL
MPQEAEIAVAAHALKPSPPVRFVDTQASALLDLMRGLAALLVLGEHWRNLLFVDYRQVSLHKKALLLPYLLTAAGHQAVIVFFVLSGYLIGGSVFRSLRSGTWSLGIYFTHRLVRLWLVLLPGLLLGLLWDETGMHLGRAPLLYGGINLNHMTAHAVASAISVKIFCGNLLFLEGWRVPLLGSNDALWSLTFEFWYYVMFPLGVLAVVRSTKAGARVACIVVLIAVVAVMQRGILLYMPIWLLGAALVAMPAVTLGKRHRWVVSILYFALVLWLGVAKQILPTVADYLLGVATLVLIWVLLSARSRADPSERWVRGARGLSRFSFTLYVVHTPLLFFLVSFGPRDARWVPTLPHVVAALAMLAATLVYAYAVAWATEFRMDTVRGFVERRLGLVQRPSPTPHEMVLGAHAE